MKRWCDWGVERGAAAERARGPLVRLHTKGRSRVCSRLLDLRLPDWCARGGPFDGVIILDECHKAKSGDKKGASSAGGVTQMAAVKSATKEGSGTATPKTERTAREDAGTGTPEARAAARRRGRAAREDGGGVAVGQLAGQRAGEEHAPHREQGAPRRRCELAGSPLDGGGSRRDPRPGRGRRHDGKVPRRNTTTAPKLQRHLQAQASSLLRGWRHNWGKAARGTPMGLSQNGA